MMAGLCREKMNMFEQTQNTLQTVNQSENKNQAFMFTFKKFAVFFNDKILLVSDANKNHLQVKDWDRLIFVVHICSDRRGLYT